MCVQTRVCIYLYIYIDVYVCVSVHACVCASVCVCDGVLLKIPDNDIIPYSPSGEDCDWSRQKRVSHFTSTN